MKLSDDEESEPLQRQQNGLRKVGRRGRPNLLPWLIAAAGSAIIIGAVILPLSSRYSLWMMLLPPSAKTLRLSAAEAEAMARRHRFLFIAGPHRGGTTLLWRLLRLHPQVGAFAERTDGDFSEGAFLQSVMPTFGVGREREDCLRAGVRRVGSPPARGVGRYGFDPGAHLTEASPLASLASRDALLSQWGYYWGEAGLERPLLLEKTPTNMLTARLLQSLFAPRTSFLVVTRHPLAVALAQHRITSCGGGGGGGGPPEAVGEAVLHWALTHTVLQRDLPALSSARVVRYEDLAHAPGRCLAAVGLRASRTPGPFLEASSSAGEAVDGGTNAKYERQYCDGQLATEQGRQSHCRVAGALQPAVAALGLQYDVERGGPLGFACSAERVDCGAAGRGGGVAAEARLLRERLLGSLSSYREPADEPAGGGVPLGGPLLLCAGAGDTIMRERHTAVRSA
ncbi:hypothetical protein EMIHUDRAFT_102450 [Emiliania huxleyi CCMP1516]|uniref:Protein-tyrosine sulfotransferase n=2 Tax=Emiliania huxleyi TaxID=2903 RepID=A0A0D3J2K6_EMIH1|nr:hypothetical protein EMIHUDRAFT_102450 [Emiliania huxleyi CCMP1516]EOD17741.1 hypothetical protein EMIHUDRAFT_102450 [Emiliania huxleyi CCMP1516]|eukprot:XP_005770170.1 hypothetical protein EMIHUDRAFT_102450 [Emiliania huxleyi CCMP1516]